MIFGLSRKIQFSILLKININSGFPAALQRQSFGRISANLQTQGCHHSGRSLAGRATNLLCHRCGLWIAHGEHGETGVEANENHCHLRQLVLLFCKGLGGLILENFFWIFRRRQNCLFLPVACQTMCFHLRAFKFVKNDLKIKN